MAPIKSQASAFRQSQKPQPKPKTPHVNKVATPKGVTKNASRNERRKAARKTAQLLKAQGVILGKKKDEAKDDGEVKGAEGKKVEEKEGVSEKMDVEESSDESG